MTYERTLKIMLIMSAEGLKMNAVMLDDFDASGDPEAWKCWRIQIISA